MSADDPDKDPHCHRHGSLISTRPLPLRRSSGRSWSPFRHPWLAWRYGWTHPDEDLLGVIDAAGDSLRAQIASAKAVLSGDALEQAEAIEHELEQELCQDVPGLAILLGLEARINALYPPVIQRRRAWMLRDRFERVAPARAVAEYWASNPPEPGGPEVLAEEVRRCEALAAAMQTALDAARAAAPPDPAAISAAEAKLGRAAAERDVARAHAEVDRCRRALAAANEAARNAANGAQGARDAAQAALDAARGALGAASDAYNAAEELLVQRGGAVPAIAGTTIDADAQTLLGYIHSSYMMSIGREKAVRDLMRWLVMRFWSANIFAVLGLLLVFFLFRILPGGGLMPLANLVVGLFLIAAVGRIGATMSVLQRLQAAVSSNILSGDSFLDLARLADGQERHQPGPVQRGGLRPPALRDLRDRGAGDDGLPGRPVPADQAGESGRDGARRGPGATGLVGPEERRGARDRRQCQRWRDRQRPRRQWRRLGGAGGQQCCCGAARQCRRSSAGQQRSCGEAGQCWRRRARRQQRRRRRGQQRGGRCGQARRRRQQFGRRNRQ